MASLSVSAPYPLASLRPLPPAHLDGNIPDNAALPWPSADSHLYLQERATSKLHEQLSALPGGTVLPCRGRDACDEPWDYGWARCQTDDGKHTRFVFEYQSGEIESFAARSICFGALVQLALDPREANETKECPTRTPQGVRPIVVLAHGWSPQVGPHYPLIQSIQSLLQKNYPQCLTVIPDFRPCYAFGELRARAERIALLWQELLCAMSSSNQISSDAPIILMGHSQGGAAVARLCTPQAGQHLNLRGLLLMGSEHPGDHDQMDWNPTHHVDRVHVVHAARDDTISFYSLRRLARHWGNGTVFTELDDPGLPDKCCNSEGDDVHHDFLSPKLSHDVLQCVDHFLRVCLA